MPRQKPGAWSPDPYLVALRLLGRRELSEAQVRQRLARRGHGEEAVDEAIVRLKAERAIDDERTAAAIARTETSLKRRGPRRVKQQIRQAGIASTIADRAIKETFDDVDEDTLLEAALRKRLTPGAKIRDDREFARLYRFLLSQGFEADRIVRTLEARFLKPRE